MNSACTGRRKSKKNANTGWQSIFAGWLGHTACGKYGVRAYRTMAPWRRQPWQGFALGLRSLIPTSKHSALVTQLALQIYDGLLRDKVLHTGKNPRRILEAAALLHDVGCAREKHGHQKESYRLIRKIVPPLGWTAQDLQAVAVVARYHCGALPHSDEKCLHQLPASRRFGTVRLAGVLRLANAFDLSHDEKIRRLHVGKHDGSLSLRGEGYDEAGPTAERLAAARYLLEINCHMPILVRSWTSVHKRGRISQQRGPLSPSPSNKRLAAYGEHRARSLSYNFVGNALRKICRGSGSRGDTQNDQIRVIFHGDSHNLFLNRSEFHI